MNRRSTPPGPAAGPSVMERDAIRRAFLALAMAHEIKQPLHSLNLNIELLAKRLAKAKIAADVGAPLEALGRVVDRINGCLEAVGPRLVPEPVEPTPRDLRPHLTAAEQRAATQARRAGVKLAVETATGLARVPVNAAQLAVALDALLTNAIQASGKGDTVTVRAAASNGHVAISVVDTGEGMTPDVLKHAVEIGFTTRGGDGTGMTVAKFVAYHHLGGFLVESRPGTGTTVTMTIPVSPG